MKKILVGFIGALLFLGLFNVAFAQNQEVKVTVIGDLKDPSTTTQYLLKDAAVTASKGKDIANRTTDGNGEATFQFAQGQFGSWDFTASFQGLGGAQTGVDIIKNQNVTITIFFDSSVNNSAVVQAVKNNKSVSPGGGSSSGAGGTSSILNTAKFSGLNIQGGGETKSVSDFIQKDKRLIDVWKAMLALVNVAVALILIGVAFATIFHIQVDTYGIKKVLPTLIVGVILANLSLLISRNLVDFAGVITATFVNAATDQGGKDAFVEAVSQGIIRGGFSEIAKFVNTGTTTGIATTGIVVAGIALVASGFLGLGIIAGAIIVAILLLIPGLLFLILAFLLYARMVALVFLTAISPIAFVGMAFAPTQGIFRQWWTQFLRWNFMAPIVFFFLWLAVMFRGVTGGEASFASYALAMIMLYMAIQMPFKLGGAVMGVWGGVGKKVFGGVTKGAWKATNAGLNKIGNTEWGQRNGIMGFDTLYKSAHKYFEDKAKEREIVPTGVASGQIAGIAGAGVVGLTGRIPGFGRLFRKIPKVKEGFERGQRAEQAERAKTEAIMESKIAKENLMTPDASGYGQNTIFKNKDEFLNHVGESPVRAAQAMRSLIMSRDKSHTDWFDLDLANDVRKKFGTEPTSKDKFENLITQINPDLSANPEERGKKFEAASAGAFQQGLFDRDFKKLNQSVEEKLADPTQSVIVSEELKKMLNSLSKAIISELRKATPAVRNFIEALKDEKKQSILRAVGLGRFVELAQGGSPAAAPARPDTVEPIGLSPAETTIIQSIQVQPSYQAVWNNLSPETRETLTMPQLSMHIDNIAKKLRQDAVGVIHSSGLADDTLRGQISGAIEKILDELKNDPSKYKGDFSSLIHQKLKSDHNVELNYAKPEDVVKLNELNEVANSLNDLVKSAAQGYKNFQDLQAEVKGFRGPIAKILNK